MLRGAGDPRETQKSDDKIRVGTLLETFPPAGLLQRLEQARSNSDGRTQERRNAGEARGTVSNPALFLSINERVANGPERCSCQMFPEAPFFWQATPRFCLGVGRLEVFGMFPVGPVLP